MYLLSSNGEVLVELCELTVEAFGDKVKGVAHRTPRDVSFQFMGRYSTLERSKLEIRRVYDAIRVGKTVYHFTEEEKNASTETPVAIP